MGGQDARPADRQEHHRVRRKEHHRSVGRAGHGTGRSTCGLISPFRQSTASSLPIRCHATGQSIADLQLPTGQVPWFPGGHCDPWNHVETAMALDVVGLHDEAAAAYGWLRDIQRPDGSWYQYYLRRRGRTGQVRRQHDRLHRCRCLASLAADRRPDVPERVLACRRPRNRAGCLTCNGQLATSSGLAIPMARRSRSRCSPARRRSATASKLLSPSPTSLGWTGRRGGPRQRHCAACIRDNEAAFAPKKRWAMDWYYPVMTGVLRRAGWA